MKVFPFTFLVSEDKSVVSERFESPNFYPYLHRHEEWQITYIEHGTGTLIAGNDMQHFKSGDLFVIGSGLPHLFKNAIDEAQNQVNLVSSHSVYFDVDAKLGPLFSLPEMKTVKKFLARNKNGFKISEEHAEMIYSLMKAIDKSIGVKLLSNFVDLMLALQTIEEHFTPICSDMFKLGKIDSDGDRLVRIVNYISDNYHKAITLEDVSDIAFMTPQAFCRYFKKHTGHTFVSYLNEVRINYARKSLILDGKLDHISSIAYKVGFSSIPNFNRVFKSIVGKSPKAYIHDFEMLTG
ncbi:helix-turn-helix domain-containing protein [Pedobacter sp. Leaf170]|uniref:AraC family transcriptional regulator n=1 Tax=Pedobacter sp. Leaf170 TaxID=2876558 RepID=UPI001E3716D9|nr:helix-turn-helix domain-containing protein [Pedobacter sp. Leaf170]